MKTNVQPKFLIIDDIRTMREEFVRVCHEFVPDACIDQASDGMEALRLLQKESPPYDAVFTDINMPQINGLKLIPMLREMHEYRKAPLIVISTLTGRSDIEHAMMLGANGYLTRPLQSEDFEVVYIVYIKPILDRKKSTSSNPGRVVESLRKSAR